MCTTLLLSIYVLAAHSQGIREQIQKFSPEMSIKTVEYSRLWVVRCQLGGLTDSYADDCK